MPPDDGMEIGMKRIGKRMISLVLLELSVILLPCLICWFRTGNSRGIRPATSRDSLQIEVDGRHLSVDNFLIQMICVDYTADMEEEALKALVVAARSHLYASLSSEEDQGKIRETGQQESDAVSGTKESSSSPEHQPEESDAWVIRAGETGVSFRSFAGMVTDLQREQGKAGWSGAYRRIRKAARDTSGICLVWKNPEKSDSSTTSPDTQKEPEFREEGKTSEDSSNLRVVDAMWYRMSAGHTRPYAGNTTGDWDGISRFCPPLKSMDGEDATLPGAVRLVVYTRRELAQRLWEVAGTDTLLSEEKPLDSWFSIEERDGAGYITQMKIGDQKMTGEEAAAYLQLSSGCFYVADTPQGIAFLVYGSGRGYGMPVAGAEKLAAEGKTYREILAWYFPVCDLSQS